MKTSSNGIKLITSFEGLVLKAYKATATEKYYTIGYGHCGADVKLGQTITKAQAESYLANDLTKFENVLNYYVLKFYPDMNQNQYDALISFTFNCGGGNLSKLTNGGKRTYKQISDALPLYCKAGGKTLQGLVKRRKKEQELFNTAVSSTTSSTTTTTTKKSNTVIAKEVIVGKWGSGTARKKKLTEAGYDYAAIQKIVNQLVKG